MCDDAHDRPGRFDLQLLIDLPTVQEREEVSDVPSSVYHDCFNVLACRFSRCGVGVCPSAQMLCFLSLHWLPMAGVVSDCSYFPPHAVHLHTRAHAQVPSWSHCVAKRHSSPYVRTFTKVLSLLLISQRHCKPSQAEGQALPLTPNPHPL